MQIGYDPVRLGLSYISIISETRNLIFHRSNLWNSEIDFIFCEGNLRIDPLKLSFTCTNGRIDVMNLSYPGSDPCNDDIGVIVLKSSLCINVIELISESSSWINVFGLRLAYTNGITNIANRILRRKPFTGTRFKC